jgi:hypothetical protein
MASAGAARRAAVSVSNARAEASATRTHTPPALPRPLPTAGVPAPQSSALIDNDERPSLPRRSRQKDTELRYRAAKCAPARTTTSPALTPPR